VNEYIFGVNNYVLHVSARLFVSGPCIKSVQYYAMSFSYNMSFCSTAPLPREASPMIKRPALRGVPVADVYANRASMFADDILPWSIGHQTPHSPCHKTTSSPTRRVPVPVRGHCRRLEQSCSCSYSALSDSVTVHHHGYSLEATVPRASSSAVTMEHPGSGGKVRWLSVESGPLVGNRTDPRDPRGGR